ncbi:MAG: OsmC family protein [Bacteroidota bacterium]
MKITLKRIDDAFHMEATNENGNTTRMDGSPKVGGSNQSMRPMQTVIAALGGCSSIDVISILKKQRQPLDDLQIEIDAEREEGAVPSLFTNIHVHYKLYGDLKEEKVKQAVDLSMEKYCSVVKILEKVAKVTWAYEIIRES